MTGKTVQAIGGLAIVLGLFLPWFSFEVYFAQGGAIGALRASHMEGQNVIPIILGVCLLAVTISVRPTTRKKKIRYYLPLIVGIFVLVVLVGWITYLYAVFLPEVFTEQAVETTVTIGLGIASMIGGAITFIAGAVIQMFGY